jgi:hypothetical protein
MEVMDRREATLLRAKDEVGRLGEDPEYRHVQSLHFRNCVLAHASRTPQPLEPEEF